VVRYALAVIGGHRRGWQGSREDRLERGRRMGSALERKVVGMEAVIATGGKQYRVTPGQVIKVERLGKDKGAAVEFTKVLLVNNDGQVTVEPKALASAKVVGQVVAERKGDKVLVVKFKRRKNYRRHRGHRQTMTAVRITKIEV
jgi:large subunit ribosomal protein L21